MRYFGFIAIPVEWDGVVVGGDDLRRVHGHSQLCSHRPWSDTVDPDAVFTQFCGLLFGQVDDGSLGRTVGNPQRAGSHARYRRDVDNGALLLNQVR